MRIRTLLLSSVTTTSLLFGSMALLPQAYAQKGSFMSPSSGWAVNEVHAAVSGQDGYCALARRFEQGAILTFAQNKDAKTSFALDFDIARFDPGAAFQVTLDPGAGLQRSYNVKPLSSKAFVVRMGNDQQFFDALERTGLLRVEAKGKSYVFDISDIDAGQSKLGRCVRSLTQPVSAPSVAPVTPDSVAMTPLPLPREVSAEGAQRSLEVVVDRAAPVLDTARLSPVGVDAQSLRAQAARQTGQSSDVSNKRASSRSGAVSRVVHETPKTVVRRSEPVEKRVTARAPDTVQSGKVAALRSENLKLQARIQNLSQSLQGLDVMEAELAALENERGDLRVALRRAEDAAARAEGAQVDVSAGYQEEIARLSSQNNKLLASLEKAKLAIVKFTSLGEGLRDKDADNAQLRGELNDALARNEALVERKEAEIAALMASQDDAAAIFNEQIAMLKNENLQQSLMLKNFEELEQELAALEAEKNGLVRDISSREEGLKVQISELDALVVDMRSENARLKTDLAALQGELEIAKAGLESKTEQALVLSALQEEHNALQAELESVKASADGEISQVAAQNVELREVLGMTIAKIETLNDVVSMRDVEISELAAANNALDGQLKLAASIVESSRTAAFLEQQRQVEIGDGGGVVASRAAVAEEPVEAPIVVAMVVEDVPKPVSKPVVAEVIADVLETAPKEKIASIQERLASIEPAAGGDVGTPAAVEEAAQEIVEDVVEDVVSGASSQMSPQAVEIVKKPEFMNRNLSEAQLHEEQLKRRLAHEQLVSASSSAPTSEPTPVEVRMSEDPFEPIEVQAETFAARVDDAVAPKVQEVAVLRRDITTVPKIPSVSEVADGVPVVQTMKRLALAEASSIDDEGPVGSAVAVAKPVKAVADVQPFVSPLVSSGASEIATVLDAANVASVDGVQRIASASGPDVTAYQWRAGETFGAGERKALPSQAAFDGFVKDYLERTESRCKGDFAIIPDNSKERAGMRADSYEVACIGAGVSSGASLVFYSDNGTFNVVAHEVDAQDMDKAMRIRDRVFVALTGASRS